MGTPQGSWKTVICIEALSTSTPSVQLPQLNTFGGLLKKPYKLSFACQAGASNCQMPNQIIVQLLIKVRYVLSTQQPH